MFVDIRVFDSKEVGLELELDVLLFLLQLADFFGDGILGFVVLSGDRQRSTEQQDVWLWFVVGIVLPSWSSLQQETTTEDQIRGLWRESVSQLVRHIPEPSTNAIPSRS